MINKEKEASQVVTKSAFFQARKQLSYKAFIELNRQIIDTTYKWKKAPLSAKAEEDKALTEVIKTSFNEGREWYGTRRIQQDLIDQELTVSRRRIGRLNYVILS